MAKKAFFVGTSGFSYKEWRGRFYPDDIPQRKWLEYYSEQFPSVEINSSFYRMPEVTTLKKWMEKVPKNFLFTMKMPRVITHYSRLQGCKSSLDEFLRRIDVLHRKKSLGCLLSQLPKRFKKNLEVLEEFLSWMPKDIKHVIEFRDDSWYDEETYKLLKKHKTSICVVSMGGVEPRIEAFGKVAYFRFHGPKDLYASPYSSKELQSWAKEMKTMQEKGKEVYAYFNNDVNAYAPFNALELLDYLN